MIQDAVADWQALSTLYEEMDGLDDAARAAWLARLRTERHRLLPQVERMLEARARVGANGFLEALPVLDVGEAPLVSQWGEGSRIGAYRLVRHLGSGGMAEVWLADRVDGAFARQVAIKLLFDHPSHARRESFVERFRRERDILASLDHPNIARLHDAGVTAPGQPWLALEYIEGESITEWCDHRSLDLQGRVRIFRQVLLAVQHAHANLVLHRDLKPANILVTGEGQVRLLDFGIAKLLEAEGDMLADTALTRQAGRLLTLQYASPEQLRGEPLTTACDIYSLGVVLYELLCGERPYAMGRMSAASLEQAILNIDPKPPGSGQASAEVAARRATTPARLKKALGGDLAAIALHAMAKRPSDRYRSAEGFSADLDRWLEGLPVEATSPSALDRAVKFVHRHALAASLASAAILAIVAAGGTALYQGARARDEAHRALAERDFVLDLLKSADPNAAEDGPMSIRNVLAAGVRRSGERFAGDPVLRADVLQQIGQVQARMGEKRDAQKTLTMAVELLRQQKDSVRWATLQIELADLHGRIGTTAEGHRLLREVEPVVAESNANHELGSRFHEVKGWLLRDERRLDEARAEVQRGLAEARLVENDNGLRVVDLLRGLADVEIAQNDAVAAVGHIEEAAIWAASTPQASPNDVIGIGLERASIRFNAGDYQVAGQVADSNASRCAQLFGERNEQCILLLNWQVQVALRLGDMETVLALLPALRKSRAELSSPVRKAQILLTAARAQGAVDHGRLDDEIKSALLQLAEADREAPLPQFLKLNANLVMAESALRRGDATDALAWLDRFVQLQSAWKTSVDLLQLRAKVMRGMAIAARGDPAVALRTLQVAGADADALLGHDHSLALIYRLNMVSPLIAMGRGTEAAALLDDVAPRLSARAGVSSPLIQHLDALRVQMKAASGRAAAAPPALFL